MNSFTFTSKGPRPRNQDFVSVVELENNNILLCIADGVGGNNGGEVASKLAVETFVNLVAEKGYTMKSAILKTHKVVLDAAHSLSLPGMATTLTAVKICDKHLLGVHVGDSRAYILRKNGIKQLSTDHSEVAKYVREGKLTKKQALEYPRKNIIYSAVGSTKDIEVDEFEFILNSNDRIVLLTDGFYSGVTKRMFRDHSKANKNIKDFGSKLIETVEEVGSSDNYSIAIAELD